MRTTLILAAILVTSSVGAGQEDSAGDLSRAERIRKAQQYLESQPKAAPEMHSGQNTQPEQAALSPEARQYIKAAKAQASKEADRLAKRVKSLHAKRRELVKTATSPKDHRQKAIKVNKEIRKLSARLRNVRSGRVLPPPSLSGTSKGAIGIINSSTFPHELRENATHATKHSSYLGGGQARSYHILQVLSKDEMLIMPRVYTARMTMSAGRGNITTYPPSTESGQPFIVSGVSTEGRTSDSVIQFSSGRIFKVVGTRTYRTAIGSTNTVPELRPFDMSQLPPKYQPEEPAP